MIDPLPAPVAPPLDGKYVVFKTEEWDEFVVLGADLPVALLDCFVIRAQDVFGSQALYGYAHTIQSALELDALPGRTTFTAEERERLCDVVERLSDLAGAWARQPHKKVPD